MDKNKLISKGNMLPFLFSIKLFHMFRSSSSSKKDGVLLGAASQFKWAWVMLTFLFRAVWESWKNCDQSVSESELLFSLSDLLSLVFSSLCNFSSLILRPRHATSSKLTEALFGVSSAPWNTASSSSKKLIAKIFQIAHTCMAMTHKMK